jgi:hypothetical protein
MVPAIMKCVVPFPKEGLPCPICNKTQRDSSTFKTHAKRVHKSLDVQTPTTCSVCQKEFDTFRAGSAHYAKTHFTRTKPKTPAAPQLDIPSTPEACAIVEELINRSPPLTCDTEPLSTQELITELLQASPTRPFTPVSPTSSAEPSPSSCTDNERSPTYEIASPIPPSSRQNICPPSDSQITDLLHTIRHYPRQPNPSGRNISPPPATTHHPSTQARRRLANLERLRATLATDTNTTGTPPPTTQLSNPPPSPPALPGTHS